MDKHVLTSEQTVIQKDVDKMVDGVVNEGGGTINYPIAIKRQISATGNSYLNKNTCGHTKICSNHYQR